MTFRVLLFLLLLFAPVLGVAANDSFSSAQKIETEHFTIYYEPDISLQALINKLNISQADELLANQKVDASSPQSQLSSMVEVLFARASDVLDMHVYSLKADIKVFATQQELSDFYNNLFHADIPCTGYAFYLDDTRTIYMSAEHFQREVLGHEMGHAIMSRYFVVQPSVKVQEVLAGYIEYQLRKSK